LSAHHAARLDEPPAQQRSKELYVVDGRSTDRQTLTDARRLVGVAREAVHAGGGHVLDESLVVFANGAVTLVLVLAESHLSIHTWPEEALVAVDLFSCGSIDGGRVVESLRAGLALRPFAVRRIGRGLEAGDGG
jgi:S-adenosylmethionine decarboxylase